MLSAGEGFLAGGFLVAAVWLLGMTIRSPQSGDVMEVVRYRIGCISGTVCCGYASLCLLLTASNTGLMILGFTFMALITVAKVWRPVPKPVKK